MGLSFSSQKVYNVVANVDVKKYTGLWYEMGKIPSWFEPGDSYNVTATYTLNSEGGIDVLNESYVKGVHHSIKGKAKPVNKDNSELVVIFNVMGEETHGNYWIVAMDTNYQWSVVTEPTGEHLWILSRDPFMSEKMYNSLLNMVPSSIDKSRIVRTKQNPNVMTRRMDENV